ncbi:hypothetical protein B0H14DRAFT_3148207 [Mycena olivaceomarginata]|nr:hypothetical protein B0H14DRAFT_3148207 [Mycena olivaceomarginata]
MPDRLVLNWDCRPGSGWNTADGSIYSDSSQSIDGTTSINIFCRRQDDIPVSQLGEIRSWISNGGKHLVAFIVGNVYNEAVSKKLFRSSDNMSGSSFSIKTFVMCPYALAFQRELWTLTWRYDESESRWNITTIDLDRRRKDVAEVISQSLDRIDITFFQNIPESTRNALIIGAVGLGALWQNAVPGIRVVYPWHFEATDTANKDSGEARLSSATDLSGRGSSEQIAQEKERIQAASGRMPEENSNLRQIPICSGR